MTHINTAEERSIYQTALEKWGMDAQMGMVQEECAELIVAISKFFRKGSTVHNNLIEELADVKIMVAEAEQILGIEHEVEGIRQAKLKRLKERLGLT